MAYENIDDLKKALGSAQEEGFARCKSVANTSIRQEYNFSDYDHHRPGESIPKARRAILDDCDAAYYNFGIVRNVIDLMADFTVKGIDWGHRTPAVQAFYRKWFKEVNGYDVSERFCNYLLRLGHSVIWTNKHKIGEAVAKEWKKSRGEEFTNIMSSARTIPSSYVFLDARNMSELFPDYGKFTNSRVFTMSLPNYSQAISLSRGQGKSSMSVYNNIIRGIPKDLRKKIISEGRFLFEEGKDIDIYHYRKDDWDEWGKPLIYSILKPLVMLEKMHLADRSALDGAISNIRLWRLGFIDPTNALNSAIPSKRMLKKVRDIVMNNISGGVLDIFWTPDLDFKESNSQVHHFLGPEKYEHVMSMIYDGLGIPPSLSGGASGTSGGFTNNFISMKVLIERLHYLRQKLVKFWEAEAKKIQKAMGFSSPAKVTFDDAVLSDENQHKKLLVELYDRNVISLEALRDQFNFLDPVEGSRIVKEQRRRDKGLIPDQPRPIHPDANKEGDKDFGGRPSGATDEEKRKPKNVSPISGKTSGGEMFSMVSWAELVYDKIHEEIAPAYLSKMGKKKIVELSDDQKSELESLCFSTLCSIDPKTDLSLIDVKNTLLNLKSTAVERETLSVIEKDYKDNFKKDMNAKNKKRAMFLAYSLSKM